MPITHAPYDISWNGVPIAAGKKINETKHPGLLAALNAKPTPDEVDDEDETIEPEPTTKAKK